MELANSLFPPQKWPYYSMATHGWNRTPDPGAIGIGDRDQPEEGDWADGRGSIHRMNNLRTIVGRLEARPYFREGGIKGGRLCYVQNLLPASAPILHSLLNSNITQSMLRIESGYRIVGQ
jgi:hypothetical protein